MRQTTELAATERMTRIEQARNALLRQSGEGGQSWVEPWIERSWSRCLSQGLRPDDKVGFDVLSAQTVRQVSEANRQLVAAAKPVLAGLARALSETGYFAILTNKDGVVSRAEFVAGAKQMQHRFARHHHHGRKGRGGKGHGGKKSMPVNPTVTK